MVLCFTVKITLCLDDAKTDASGQHLEGRLLTMERTPTQGIARLKKKKVGCVFQ